MLLRIYVHARHKDAVGALEVIKPILAACRSPPDRIASELILPLSKHQGHIERDPSSGKWFQRIQAGGTSRHFYHAILVPSRPFLAEFDVSPHSCRIVQAR